MKSSKYIVLGLLIITVFGSCKKWLNVNTDPDNPNNQSVPVQNKLSWIENYWKEPAGVTNMRTSCISGVIYAIATNQNSLSTTWQALNGNSTTPYQAFFVGVASNITDMYNKAQ